MREGEREKEEAETLTMPVRIGHFGRKRQEGKNKL